MCLLAIEQSSHGDQLEAKRFGAHQVNCQRRSFLNALGWYVLTTLETHHKSIVKLSIDHSTAPPWYTPVSGKTPPHAAQIAAGRIPP